jgi:mutator protein MutT
MEQINAAIAIVRRGQKILICQRKAEDVLGGFWEFPGGKCEPGESLEQCLARELAEELCIRADPLRQLTTIEHSYPTFRVRLHPFLCRHREGEVQLIECQDARWIELSELRHFKFPPANESLFAEIEAICSENVSV